MPRRLSSEASKEAAWNRLVATLLKLSVSEGPVFEMDRIVPIVAHAVAVFGDEGKASHWLSTPLALLDNRTPAQVLARGEVGEVGRILTRIEHNIPS